MLSTMMTVLVTMLLSFLGIAVLLKFGVKFYFQRYVKSMLNAAMGSATGFAPMAPRITMELEKIQFSDPQVRHFMDELKALGYRSAGRYTVPELPQLKIWSGTHIKDGSLALVMEVQSMYVSMDVIRFHDNGSAMGAGTNPLFRSENYPPHLQYKQFPLTASAADVVQWLRNRPLLFPIIAATHKNLRQLNTNLYAECTDFQLARPLPTYEEFRIRTLQDFERIGKSPPELSEAQWRTGYEQHRNSLLDAMDGALKDHLLRSGSISAQEWDSIQYDLVFIHDRLMDEDIAIRALSRSEWTSDHPRIERLMSKGIAPAKLFESIQALLPADERFHYLATVDKPVPSRVYVPSNETSDSGIVTQTP